MPRYVLWPIAVLIAVGLTGAATMQPAAAQVVVVGAAGTACHGQRPMFTSIQAAVNGAVAGTIILVCPGIYSEQVVITRNNLTIRGSNPDAEAEREREISADRTVLRPTVLPVDPGSPITGAARKAILLVNGATGVTVTNLTIDGSAADTGTLKFGDCFHLGFALGIYYRNSTGTVGSTHTTNIRSGSRCSAGIFIEAGNGTAANVVVNGNTLDKYGSDGLVCNGKTTACTVTGNTLRGLGPVEDNQSGIVLRSGAAGRVRLNSVSGHLCTDPSCGPDLIKQFQAAGIVVEPGNAIPSGTISDNRVADNDIGIYQVGAPDCCIISENHLSKNRFFGIVIQDGNGTTFENEIKGGQIGIGVAAASVDTVGVLRGDEISRTTVAPVREFACCGFKATAIVKKD